jgi:hypothetical protein
MAAIPPFHEEPPVGTNNAGATPTASSMEQNRERPPDEVPAGPAAAPTPHQVEQRPPLPADWSPVAPSAPADAP